MICRICSKSLRKKRRSIDYHQVSDEPIEYECVHCYRTRSHAKPADRNADQERSTEVGVEVVENRVTINLERSISNHKRCVFLCSRSNVLRQLSREECMEIFIKTNIFVPYGSRICKNHGSGESLTIPEGFTSYQPNVSMTGDEVKSSLLTLKNMVIQEREKTQRQSFLQLDPTQLLFETGLNLASFRHIYEYVSHLNSQNNELALGIYLSRLRRGYTFEELGNRWMITRQTASKYCDQIRQSLLGSFCERNISFARTRGEILENQTKVSQLLQTSSSQHGAIIFDGTYLRIEKSFDFEFQRQTWSVHKHYNLLKPMMAVYPNGKIAGIWGPYSGKKNDATILNDLLKKPIWNSFKPGDVFIVDRGFRDSVEEIEKKGFGVKIPAFAQLKQLTTEQANLSRLVTKNRYMVEVVNGRINRNNQYFANVIRNTTVSSAFDDFLIACAIYNFTFTPVEESAIDIIMAERMLRLVNEKNKLLELVSDLNLNARKSWFQKIELASLEDFPRLEIDDLRLYACGSYQVKMAPFYYADHVNESGDFEFCIAKDTYHLDYQHYGIDIHTEDAILIKVRIHSRHSSATKYFVYLLVDKEDNKVDSILGHYCGCKVGKRVVGCCSHAMVLLWYFGYARHLESIPPTPNHSEFLMSLSDDEGSDQDEDNDS